MTSEGARAPGGPQANEGAGRDFRPLLEKMSDSVCVHRDGKVLWGNRAFLEQLGRERVEDVVGLDILNDIVHPDDRAELSRTMRLPAPSTGLARRFRVPRPDGSSILIEISEPQLIEFDGGPARLVVGRDITERRREESAIVVSDRMASIGMLAAGVAHEVNNPLAYVHANLVLAQRELAKGGGSLALRESIADALEGTERVRVIMRDLGTLARGDVEHVEIVELGAVVRSAATLAKKSIEPRARLELALSPGVAVRANRARLGQVILNLLLNAAGAIAEGAPETNAIVVTSEPAAEGEVALSVRDTGSGIDPRHLQRLFDPFFTTKGPSQGTGLGLSICHRIVTALGGRIEVESKRGEGHGTTFRVVLPAAAEAPRETPAPAIAGVVPGGRRGRVLAVDDEPRILAVLVDLLSDYDVVTASGAEAALTELRRDGEYDVVLCDLMMAGMSGVSFFEALSAELPDAARRVVFMTGSTFTPDAQAFLTKTRQPWLDKPFALDRLLAVVQGLVAARSP